MPKPYPKNFRDNVVKVARQRPDRTTLEQIAKDFGIHPMTLSAWMKKAAIDAGERPGATSAELAKNRVLVLRTCVRRANIVGCSALTISKRFAGHMRWHRSLSQRSLS